MHIRKLPSNEGQGSEAYLARQSSGTVGDNRETKDSRGAGAAQQPGSHSVNLNFTAG